MYIHKCEFEIYVLYVIKYYSRYYKNSPNQFLWKLNSSLPSTYNLYCNKNLNIICKKLCLGFKKIDFSKIQKFVLIILKLTKRLFYNTEGLIKNNIYNIIGTYNDVNINQIELFPKK